VLQYSNSFASLLVFVFSQAADSLKFVTEEYRKYRVRSEVARKELEGRLRRGERREAEKTIAQENAAKQNAIDSPLIRQGLEKRVEKMKNELAEQELQWKEAYDSLLKEVRIGNRSVRQYSIYIQTTLILTRNLASRAAPI
jgi:hypothetical protein